MSSWKSAALVAVPIAAAAGAVGALLSQEEPLYWEWDNGLDDRTKRTAIDTDDISFPKGFLWGVSTAAHQIEGNNTNNQWHQWEQQQFGPTGRPTVRDHQVSGQACDHYNRVNEDIELIKELGCNAYRFSIEWSRIEPHEGLFDQAAIEHYRDEIAALLKAGITPFITLHHFTNPIWFEDLGAFEVEQNISHFVRFCVRVFEEYGSMVKYWCTINETEVYTASGYFNGDFPPGKTDWALAARVLRNLLEAHVQVYYALKALPGGKEAQIGIVKNVFQFEAFRMWHPLDVYIAHSLNNVFNNTVVDFFRTGQFEFRLLGVTLLHKNPKAKTSNDFIGLNYYSHYHVQFQMNLSQPFILRHHRSSSDIMTDMPYPLYPEGLYRALQYLHKALHLPIYVTENGLADAKDDRRHLFLRRYLYALSRAIQDGVHCRGYFYWSLYDNFEWAEGYQMRFGLYHVDFKTQKRTLRDGSKYYQQVIQRFK